MTIGKKIEIYILAFLLLCGFLVRLYRFDGPIADWHSWRQADTSAVSRNFVNDGFDLLHPKFDDLSNVASGLDNPEGYRFVEFPIYNVFQAGFFKTIGILTLEQWGRLVSILSSLVSAIFLYLIFSNRGKNTLGLLATFFFLFTPYSIYYSRTILPDPMGTAALLGAIYFFQLWINKAKYSIFSLQFIISLVLMSSAILIRPYSLFFVLPIVYLAYEKFGFEMFKKWQLWFYAALSIVPFGLWRIWMQNFPQGIPQSSWLLNGNGIRFRPAFFRWIFYERLTKLISGYLGALILVAAVATLRKHKDWLFYTSFAASSIFYITIFATGNVQHDYYQNLIIPTVSIFFALGTLFLYKYKYKQIEIGKAILIVSLFSLFVLGWGQIKDYFNINNPSIIAAGAAVDKLTPRDAKVIANYNGDTSFLYQTKRKGWASFSKSVPQLINMGADYLVFVNPTSDEINFGKPYKIVEQTEKYIIFKLK